MRALLTTMAADTALDDARAAMRLADDDPARAGPVAAQALLRARRDRDPAAASVAERALGYTLMMCRDMDGAARHLRAAVRSGQRARAPVLIAQARVILAFAVNQQGRPAEALKEIAAALVDLDGLHAAKVRAQRGVILWQAGRLDEAFADFQAALPVLRRAGDTHSVQRTLVNRGLLHAERYAFELAVADLGEAAQLCREQGRELSLGIVEGNLGWVETLRGDVPAALEYLGRAERRVETQGGLLGPIIQDQCGLLLSVGLLSEARDAANRAVGAYQRERRHLRTPEARLQLAQIASLDRDWAVALLNARAAAGEFTRQGRLEWAALARLTVVRAQLVTGRRSRVSVEQVDAMVRALAGAGWPAAALEGRLVAAELADRRGRDHQATTHLRLAHRSARRGPAALRARARYAEALLCLRSGDVPGATAAVRRGLRILDDHSAALGAVDLRAHAALHRGELTELGLRTALASGRPARVFEWAERGRASQLLHRPARPPQDPTLARLLSELRSVSGEIEAPNQSGPGNSRLVRRQIELERRIRDHSRLRRGCRLTNSPVAPVTPARLGAALGEWGLVEYAQLDGILHAMTLAGGRLRMRTLGSVAEVAGLVERLPFALHRLARGASSSAAALTLLAHAAEALDSMLLRSLPELDDRPLVVVPTGQLHGVPWSTLPSCHGRPITVSPSATLWHTTASTEHPEHAVTVAAGPGLPGAREEAHTVAAIHGTTALLDEKATADAVLAAIATSDIVHLAAHGRLSPHNPLFSSLLLTDGPLVVYDVERLPRVPRTVVLAACDAGRNMVHTGDELLGLAATFIAAGTTALIASVVAIPDAETTPLMAAFHRCLASGSAPAEALALAQRDIGAGDPRSLASAAGFVCIGSRTT